jgi:hypothetical protein
MDYKQARDSGFGIKRMKKLLTSVVAVALVALVIANVYAQVPAPNFCGCLPCGFSPGFWKHNLRVYLDYTKGKYSAFEGGPLDGVKLTDEMMESFLDDIGSFTAEEALGYLMERGWSTDRTNTANWFNKVTGYGPY